MKPQLIGQGWQYRVYNLGNGRVRKVELKGRSSFFARFFALQDTFLRPIASLRRIRAISQATREHIAGLKLVLEQIPPWMFGNPTFVEGHDYEQDKVAIIGEFFESHSFNENREVIRAYVKLVIELWRYGCGDTVFNFTINNGVDAEGRVIFADIGEFAFDKEVVASLIKEKKWLKQYTYTHLLRDTQLKYFFALEMDRLATLENLEKLWATNLNNRAARL